ncbi:MAG: D-alanine--D-alanine ligase [Rhodospirillaceae bacterium]|nr:D-alanine--D-alanine ligase [Rhodospirillaceae bacterium]
MVEPLHVAVLMGGWSSERRVSLVSGAACAEALRSGGFRVTEIDMERPDLAALLAALTPAPDVVFNALHGRGGEDGVIQGALELMGVPYTHSGVAASAIAMDKPLTKAVMASAGMRVPEGTVVAAAEVAVRHVMEPPYVVKPADEGSSVDVHLVLEGSNAVGVPELAGKQGRVLVERYIPGKELTVGVMGDRALAVTEVRYDHGFFDYDAKYVAGHAVHVLPADVPAEIHDRVMEWALLAHTTLGCAGISRSDFRWDESEGLAGVHFLEVNTQPGFTPISLVPEQAALLGIGFGDLCRWLVEEAQCRH